jgi:hypothetical protein
VIKQIPDTSGGMHGPTAIRFYEINTPLTEAVLPDGRNYKNNFVFVLSVTMKKNGASSRKVTEFGKFGLAV